MEGWHHFPANFLIASPSKRKECQPSASVRSWAPRALYKSMALLFQSRTARRNWEQPLSRATCGRSHHLLSLSQKGKGLLTLYSIPGASHTPLLFQGLTCSPVHFLTSVTFLIILEPIPWPVGGKKRQKERLFELKGVRKGHRLGLGGTRSGWVSGCFSPSPASASAHYPNIPAARRCLPDKRCVPSMCYR